MQQNNTQVSATHSRTVAYFSMEIALEQRLPTYSGGLGVLAGDTLKAAADMGLPVCAVSLMYHKGYFRQSLAADGTQSEEPLQWNPDQEQGMTRLKDTVRITVEGRTVEVGAYRYDIRGVTGHVVPVFFLTTNIAANKEFDRSLTDSLYGGDDRYRLAQEAVLGIGGVQYLAKVLPAMPGFGQGISTWHMNEGHAALLTVALTARETTGQLTVASRDVLERVRSMCVFTTHTPVPAGHDRFPVALVEKILGPETAAFLTRIEVCPAQTLNMTELAMRMSRFMNGVAMRHGEVSRRMFPGAAVSAITNGVHAVSWTADAMRTLFDKHVGGWRVDNSQLRHAVEIPDQELWQARTAAKQALFDEIARVTRQKFDASVFTIGFARRAAEYKRADLLFENPERLAEVARRAGRLQIVYAGKAHPRDLGGKALIKKVFEGAALLKGAPVDVVYLPDYGMHLGRLICSGVDLWLNNPVKPLEASGTSGMKAAINGVPSLSTLDGWWVEGCVPGVTGWEINDPADAFGGDKDKGAYRLEAAESIYQLLEREIIPMFQKDRAAWARVMRQSIWINGSFFNTHRMVLQYFVQAYQKAVEVR